MNDYNSTTNNNKFPTETVLLLVAGGSLGAYECGVFKSLAKHNIWFDIIAGTSIGAVNSVLITDSLRKSNLLNKKNREIINEGIRHKMLIEAAKRLEDFWLASADNAIPGFLPFKVRSYTSAANTFTLGHPNALTPIWFYVGGPLLNNGFTSPYLYDTTRFKQTLEKTIHFKNLRPGDNSTNYISSNSNGYRNNNNNNNNNNHEAFCPRLILASTDIQKAEPVLFDTDTMDITSEQLSACIAYPYYGLKWANMDGKYLWDGSLLSSSPLKPVMRLSPFKQKRIISIDTFPRHQQKIPNNFAEAWHRARDITFLDKSQAEVDVSDDLKPIFPLLEEMHNIIVEAFNMIDDKNLKKRIEQLDKKYGYDDIIRRRGRIIDDLLQIRRYEDEKSHHSFFEDWDYSLPTIKELIRQGEQDADSTLQQTNIKT